MAASASAGTYLTNVKCTNCDTNALIKITEPKDNWAGWFGGCGRLICTGLKNLIVQDLTGDLLGTPSTIIPNNSDIADSDHMSPTCTYNSIWNGYQCSTTEFGVLEWSAIGSDKQKLNPTPVTLSNGLYNNTINMWREWGW